MTEATALSKAVDAYDALCARAAFLTGQGDDRFDRFVARLSEHGKARLSLISGGSVSDSVVQEYVRIINECDTEEYIIPWLGMFPDAISELYELEANGESKAGY